MMHYTILTIAVMLIVGGGEGMKIRAAQKPANFQITRVSKQSVGDSYKIRVEYTSETEPLSVEAIFRGTQLAPATPETLQKGVVEHTIPQNLFGGKVTSYASGLIFKFYFDGSYSSAMIDVNSAYDVMDVPRVDMNVNDGNDVTYDSGSDAVFHTSLDVTGDVNALESETSDIKAIMMSDTEPHRAKRFGINLSPAISSYDTIGGPGKTPIWLELVRFGGSKGHWEADLRVSSDVEHPRGLIQFTGFVAFNCQVNCLLRRLDDMRILGYYSRQDPQPFPPGFLGFVEDSRIGDPSQLTCLDHLPCAVYCEAVGSELTSVDIAQLSENGDASPVDHDSVSFSDVGFGFAKYYVSELPQGQPENFRCTARSESGEVAMDVALRKW